MRRGEKKRVEDRREQERRAEFLLITSFSPFLHFKSNFVTYFLSKIFYFICIVAAPSEDQTGREIDGKSFSQNLVSGKEKKSSTVNIVRGRGKEY